MKNISPPLDCNGIFLQVLESDAWAYKRQIQNSITLAIERARSHIYIVKDTFTLSCLSVLKHAITFFYFVP
jgi:hypothetical protein